MNRDKISKIICDRLNLMAYTVVSVNTVSDITGIHKTSPNATYALGRTINATALLSATLKQDSDQNITVKFTGSGVLKEVQAQADARGNIRGYVMNPDADLMENLDGINFSRAIGAGFLIVTKDSGLKEPYNSVMSLEKGEVAADIAYYLSVSEQIPSALIIGMNVGGKGEILSSGGILIQSLPEATDEILKMVEHNILTLPRTIGEMLDEGEDIYNIVAQIFNNEPLSILSSYPLKHSCRCSPGIIESIIRSLDKKEIFKIIGEDKVFELTCTFCKKNYPFNEEDIKRLDLRI